MLVVASAVSLARAVSDNRVGESRELGSVMTMLQRERLVGSQLGQRCHSIGGEDTEDCRQEVCRCCATAQPLEFKPGFRRMADEACRGGESVGCCLPPQDGRSLGIWTKGNDEGMAEVVESRSYQSAASAHKVPRHKTASSWVCVVAVKVWRAPSQPWTSPTGQLQM